MDSNYQYFAFISYKREDEKYAKWIQNKLESYRLPSAICKKHPELPRRIAPVFRDKTDIGAGMLRSILREELLASRYLIVICSPAAAKSEWCGLEISEFIKAGKADKIIPVIVSGSPFCDNPEMECFHPVIRENIPEVLGININEIGKEQAFIKIVSQLLGVKYSVLWDRFLRRKRTIMRCLCALALILLSSVFLLWDYYRVKERYYADYVDCFGIPQGVVELSQSEINRRNSHYVFEYSRRKLQRVIYANSSGQSVDHGNTEYVDRAAVQEFTYSGNRLLATDMFNSAGHHIVTHLWGGDEYDSIDIKEDMLTGNSGSQHSSFSEMSHNMFAEADVRQMPRQIRRYKLFRDEEGHIVGKIFKKNNGDDMHNVADAYGVVGYKYTLDDKGRPIRIDYLGCRADETHINERLESFDVIADRNGIACRKYEYDSYGNLCRESFYDLRDSLVYNEKLYCMVISTSDSNGNIVKMEYAGHDGGPCCCAYGYASSRMSYDSDGNLVQIEYFGIYDVPVTSKESGAHKIVLAYDKYGNVTEYRLYDLEGRMTSPEGFSLVRYAYERGNMISQAFFNEEGEPTLASLGFHQLSMKYDESGNCTSMAAYDCEGSPVVYTDGVHMIEYIYTDNRLDQEVYYDTDLQRCYSNEQISGVKYGYVNNTLSCKNFIDEYGQVCYNSDGVAGESYEYDEDMNVSKKHFISKDAGHSYCNDGYSATQSRYDEKGNLIEFTNMDAAGYATGDNDGIAIVKCYYDKYGNRIRQSLWDYDNRRVEGEAGYAELVRVYDRRHNIVSESLYDRKGEPYSSSYSEVMFTYDSRDNRISARYSLDGVSVMLPEGYAEVRYEYDAYDREIKRSYHITDGTLSRDLSEGYPVCRTEYDPKGNVATERYFTSDSCGAALVKTYKYDDRGNVIMEANLDAAGKPVLNKEGYYMFKYAYDEHDRVVETEYLSSENAAGGVFCKKNRFDRKGNLIEVSYSNADSTLVLNPKTSVARFRYEYNEKNKLVSVSCFGTDLSPTCYGDDRFVRKTIEYDDKNLVIRERFYDAQDCLVVSKAAGYAEKVINRDPYGRSGYVGIYDAEGNDIALKSYLASEGPRHKPRSNIHNYVDLVRKVARAEMFYVPSVLNLEYEELMSIGVIAVQVLVRDKTPEQLSKYNSLYLATAISWAIKNELGIRYKAYDDANQNEFAGLPSEIQNVDVQMYTVRERIYTTLLSIDQADDSDEELTMMGYYVRQAVQKLPEEARTIFEQRVMQRKKWNEIADGGDVQRLIVSLSDSFDYIKHYLEQNKYKGY